MPSAKKINRKSNVPHQSVQHILPSRTQPMTVATIMTIRYYVVSFFWLFLARAGAQYIINKRCLYEKKMGQYKKEWDEWEWESSGFLKGYAKKKTSEGVDAAQEKVENASGVGMEETFKGIKEDIHNMLNIAHSIFSFGKTSSSHNHEPKTPPPVQPTEDKLEEIINYVMGKNGDMCIYLQHIVDGTMGNVVFGLLAVGGWKHMVQPWKIWQLIYNDVLYWQSHDKPLFDYLVKNLLYHPLPDSLEESTLRAENAEMMEKLRKENERLTKNIVSRLDKSDQKKLAIDIKKISQKKSQNFRKTNAKALQLIVAASAAG